MFAACLQDAYLPQRLLDKLMLFVNYTEMARVTGVPFNYVLTRGQQVRVISKLYRKALEDNFVVPALKTEGWVRDQRLLQSLALRTRSLMI